MAVRDSHTAHLMSIHSCTSLLSLPLRLYVRDYRTSRRRYLSFKEGFGRSKSYCPGPGLSTRQTAIVMPAEPHVLPTASSTGSMVRRIRAHSAVQRPLALCTMEPDFSFA